MYRYCSISSCSAGTKYSELSDWYLRWWPYLKRAHRIRNKGIHQVKSGIWFSGPGSAFLSRSLFFSAILQGKPRLLLSLQDALLFRRSRIATNNGKSKLPPGSKKTAMAGIPLDRILRWLFISITSSAVHFSPVLRGLINNSISPLTARTSRNMNSLFPLMSLLQYLRTSASIYSKLSLNWTVFFTCSSESPVSKQAPT